MAALAAIEETSVKGRGQTGQAVDRVERAFSLEVSGYGLEVHEVAEATPGTLPAVEARLTRQLLRWHRTGED